MKKLLQVLFLPIRLFFVLLFVSYKFVKKIFLSKVIWPITAVVFFYLYFFRNNISKQFERIGIICLLTTLFLSMSPVASKLEYKISQLGGIPSLFVFLVIVGGCLYGAYTYTSGSELYAFLLVALFFLGVWGTFYTVIRFFRRQKPILILTPRKWPSIWRQWFLSFKAIITKYIFRAVIIFLCTVIVMLWFRVGRLERQVGIRSWNCNEQAAIDTTKKAIVRIATKDGEGTGFFIHPEGVIVTNAHVVGDDIAPKIIFSDYSFATSRVIARYKDEDIAVLQIDKKEIPYLNLLPDVTIEPQEEVFIVGYPMGTTVRGEPTTVRTQYIAERTFKDDPSTFIQLETGIDGGFSGSPVVNACGDVIGIATMSTNTSSMAIKGSFVIERITPPDPGTAIGQLPEVKRELKDSFDLPSDVVIAYYDAIRARRFRLAYDLMSFERIKNTPFEEWIKGYVNTMDATVMDYEDVKDTPGVVNIRLRAIDLVGQDMVMTYYEGQWTVIKEDNAWKLGDSNIKKIDQTPWWAWW